MLPTKLKKHLEVINFWEQKCIHSGKSGVQAEHALFYGRKQINELWAIVPVAPEYNYNPSTETKERSMYVAMIQCKQMGKWEEVKSKYPKKNWDKEFELLSQKHNTFEFYPTIFMK